MRFELKNLLVILLCSAAAAPLCAKNIYKYQDENGIWHFTDKLPNDQEEFEAVWMEREPEPRITMRREGDERNPVYMLHNRYWGPAEVELSMSRSQNVMTEPQVPLRVVLGPPLNVTVTNRAAGKRQRAPRHCHLAQVKWCASAARAALHHHAANLWLAKIGDLDGVIHFSQQGRHAREQRALLDEELLAKAHQHSGRLRVGQPELRQRLHGRIELGHADQDRGRDEFMDATREVGSAQCLE